MSGTWPDEEVEASPIADERLAEGFIVKPLEALLTMMTRSWKWCLRVRNQYERFGL